MFQDHSKMATDQVNTSTSENNITEFNYNDIKKDFNLYIKLSDYELLPKTRKDISNIINILKRGNIEQKRKYNSQFAIIKRNKHNILVKKCMKNKMQEIVPLDEYFDVIVEAHVLSANHRKRALLSEVTEKYYIPGEWIHRFLAMCNVCNPVVPDNPPKASTVELKVHLSIEKILVGPTSEYQALFYIDEVSQYVLVRHLKEFSKNEIAVELLKIFSDFGAPERIYTNYSLWDIISEAIKMLSNLSLPFVLPMVSLTQLCKAKELIGTSVFALISRWMLTQNIDTWPLALSCIQFEINTNHKMTKGIVTSNYNDFFRVKQNLNLYKFAETGGGETDGSKKDICSACSLSICKVYKCHKCAKPFHFTCSVRETVEEANVKKMIVTCFSCKNVPTL